MGDLPETAEKRGVAATNESACDRDRRTGRFVTGNRAQSRRPAISRAASRLGHGRNPELASLIAQKLTEGQIMAHIARLDRIIKKGDDKDALAAFKLLYGHVNEPPGPRPKQPESPKPWVIELPDPDEVCLQPSG
jgi:hypothetical protein